MNCNLICIIAAGFIVAMLVSMLFNGSIMDKFISLLDDKQLLIYKKLTRERMMGYIVGLVIGLLLAGVVVFLLKNKFKDHQIPLSCLFVLLLVITHLVVYMVYPKSDYIIKHLNTEAQRTAWLDVYNTMKLKFYGGFVAGSIGFGLLCFVMTDKKNN